MRPQMSSSRVALCIAIILVGTPACLYGECEPGRTTPIFEIDGVALEGITVTWDGTIYASGDASGKIFKRTPDGVVSEVASLWDYTPGDPVFRWVAGLTSDDERTVYAAVADFLDPGGHGVWRIDKNDLVEFYGQLPLAAPNGITVDDMKNVYVGDHLFGRIFRVSPNGEVELWVDDPLLRSSGATFHVNGLDHYEGAIYASITLDGRVVKVPISADGSAGTPENYVESDLLIGVDHAVFDGSGNLYAANVYTHTIVKVDRDLVVTSFIESDPNIYKPASLSLGGVLEPFSLYVTNYEDAFDKFPPPDPEPNPADVVKVDFCPECSDGIDNDSDGLVDWPDDPGCHGRWGATETPECNDGMDNDGDTLVDYPDDPNCPLPWVDDESRVFAPKCGLGVELALVLPALMWLARRRRGSR